jgi:hypothetical protein
MVSVGTAFHPRTSQLNSKMAWGEWSGYFAAAVYADFHDIEYNAIREQAALIDVTPLYKSRPGRTPPARRPRHDARRRKLPSTGLCAVVEDNKVIVTATSPSATIGSCSPPPTRPCGGCK